MSGLRGAHLLSGSAILILAAAAAVGCSKPSEEGEKTMGAPGRWLAGYPGKSTAATHQYMTQRVKFPGAAGEDTVFEGDYPCASCPGGSVKLTVTPEQKAFQIDWNRAFRDEANEGAIVAKFNNTTADSVPEFGLKKNDSVYMWVGPINDDGSQRAVAFYHINAEAGSATRAPTMYTVVNYCDMPGSQGRSRSAAHGQHPESSRCHKTDYPSLPGYPAASKTALQATSLFRNVSYSTTMFRSSGTWISCMYGCCEVGYAE